MKKLLAFYILSYTTLALSQTANKKYINTNGNFSIELPQNWSVLNDNTVENRIAICVPSLDKELKEYANCYAGIVFYIEKYKTDLQTTLINKGYLINNDSVFALDKKNKKIEVAKLQKNNYKGAYNQVVCNFICKDSDKATSGKCDFLFFNINSRTICIYTNGKPLSAAVKNNIIASFKFI